MALRGGIARGTLLASAGLTVLLLTASVSAQPAESPRTAVLKPTSTPYIDAHVHILQTQPEQAVNLLLDAMKRLLDRARQRRSDAELDSCRQRLRRIGRPDA